MSLSYLPGRPNDTQQSTCQSSWQGRIVFAYCSGNNLIILSNGFQRLQTIYLESDSVAVDINQHNGFIAIGYGNKVGIYKPRHQVMREPSWVFCCEIIHDDSKVNSLSWGSFNDIAIGSDYLSFWKVIDEFGIYKPVVQWNKKQPKPVYLCITSQCSQMIASFGKYDTSVKLWKRISISGDQVLFNLTLLPHPSPVCTLRWKRSGQSSPSENLNGSQAIYTLCADKKLRVWLCYELDSLHNIQHWATLQLEDNQRYCFTIDSWLLKGQHDLVLVADREGHLDIYSLSHLSSDPPRPVVKEKLFTKSFSYSSFVTNPDFLYFSEAQPCDDNPNEVSLVVHDLRGVIRQSRISVSQLLGRQYSQIGTLEHKFTGHNKSVQKLIRSSDGEAMLTTSRFLECCVWCPQHLSDKSSLKLKSVIITEAPVKHAILQEKGKLVICLLENSKLQAWECAGAEGKSDLKKSHLKFEQQLEEFNGGYGKPLLLLNTPEAVHRHDRHFIALIYEDGAVRAFEISSEHGIREIQSENLNIPDHQIHHISTIDPVHRSFFSDRPLISLMSKDATAITYKAIFDYEKNLIRWYKSCEIHTGMKDVVTLRGSSTGKLCTVHCKGKKMSLWDFNKSVLEYEESFDDEIKDVDWTSTEYGQSIVSVGFSGYALLYTQLRYDYTNHNPSYLPIEKIDITSHTDHQIGDSIWLKNGMFVVASGNQFYIKDKSLDLNDSFTRRSIGSRRLLSNDILHLSSVLNGPLPVYHPQFLIQAVYANKLQLVKELLLRLFLELRKLSFESEDYSKLSSNLKTDYKRFLAAEDDQFEKLQFPDPYPEFNTTVAVALGEQLTKITLPYLTRHQQITLSTIVEAVEEIRKNESVVDYNGIRFLLGVKLYTSHKNSQKTILMRDVNWALHSDNKEVLLSILDNHITSWRAACEYRISFWATEKDLTTKFDQIAKFEFSRDDKRDPSRCGIFYLALKKKKILCSLWKISIGHPDQQKMMKFLSNDFSEERWRKAALKNAFVLLSKHRYMDAACFFLLAGSLKDCLNVLFKQVKDLDLAIGVCRIFEGDNGPVLGEFLTQQILPNAILHNDRWICSFVYWKLKRQDKAIRTLVMDPFDLEKDSGLINNDSNINKSFLAEDPALLMLYSHLRKRNIKYFLGSLKVERKLEYCLISRVADILRRMGCDYLALSLVRNWEFIDEYEILLSSKNQNTFPDLLFSVMNSPPRNRRKPSFLEKLGNGSIESIGSSDSKSGNKTKNLLDDFISDLPSKSSASTAPKQGYNKDLLASDDEMKSSVSKSTPIANSNTTIESAKKAPPSQPRNLLDDFM